MSEKIRAGDKVDAAVIASRAVNEKANVYSLWEFQCLGGDGQVKWVDHVKNMVLDEGLNKLLGIMFAGSSQYSGWYVGLVDGASVTPAGSWQYTGIGSSFTENTTYTAGTRESFTPGAVASKQVSNTGSKASFTISGSSQIQVCGAFLCAGPNASTKGNNASGNIIYAISQFSSGAKTLDPADVLKVTVTLTAADA
jgi:hypothetical protein